jgi:hypothetical protein
VSILTGAIIVIFLHRRKRLRILLRQGKEAQATPQAMEVFLQATTYPYFTQSCMNNNRPSINTSIRKEDISRS